ncbi:MAG: sulfotransferase [Myxococcota bacterium]|nr:sulfotransferase [Myxococcota bacterium]MEC8424737.1 sulfotransferase [Myxococcota bacterium]
MRNLVLLVSSSRGGSSVFAEALRRIPGTLHLRAEVNPFLRLAGLGWPASGLDSDALDPDARGDVDAFARQLAWDIGRPARAQPDLAEDLAWRLRVQWPALPLDDAALLALVRSVPGSPSDDHTGFHIDLLRHLRDVWDGMNPRSYDLDRGAIDAAFPGEPKPDGPPGRTIIEEPPFVAIGPWHRATAQELATMPLVIKAPSNAYRLSWFRETFPHARIRLLHLVRNPAAAINGLYDGWRSGGFHAHRVDQELDIAGYSDHQPRSRCWWKFDLPPGWRDHTHAPLVSVCAFQWTSAHRAVLSQPLGLERKVFHFERFVRGASERVQLMAEVSSWLGAPAPPRILDGFREPPPTVMSTARPRLQRWFARRAAIEPVIAHPEVRQLAKAMGCGPPDAWV